jgi:microcystin-dependent protein
MTLYKWSQTASADATADSTINWAEGQAPSSVNDSARGMMAATAKYRDDIAGAIVTTGSSTAYAVSSYQGFDTLVHLSGQMIAFTPHITNAATVTLNVDSLGDRPLRSAPGVELQAGTIIQGTPYVAVYNNGDGAFYIQGFFGNPYNVPIGAGMDYWGTTAPNSSFVFPVGQAVSRIAYSALFSIVGTTYGTGDGSTTFNLPDKRGRVSVAADPTATVVSSATMNPSGGTLGATGGEQEHQLAVSEMPSHSHSASVIDPGHSHSETFPEPGGGSNQNSIAGASSSNFIQTGLSTGTAETGITVSIGAQGGGMAHNNMQPSIVCNYIMRII